MAIAKQNNVLFSLQLDIPLPFMLYTRLSS